MAFRVWGFRALEVEVTSGRMGFGFQASGFEKAFQAQPWLLVGLRAHLGLRRLRAGEPAGAL